MERQIDWKGLIDWNILCSKDISMYFASSASGSTAFLNAEIEGLFKIIVDWLFSLKLNDIPSIVIDLYSI